MKKHRLIFYSSLIVVFLLSFYQSSGQGEIDDGQKILIRNERSLAFSINSNGFGGNFRYGHRTSGFKKNLYQIDFCYIKHPKELKTTSPYVYSNKSFVYGKLNSFYSLRFTFGRQNEIYSKYDKGGVAINYFFQGGPVIGILKPRYFEVSYEPGKTEIEDFSTFYSKNQNYHIGFIMGYAPYLEGIENTKIKPGITASAGFNFEFSLNDKHLNAIESGISCDLYPDDIPLMFNEENDHSQLFLSLYLSYRFGKILDGRSKHKD